MPIDELDEPGVVVAFSHRWCCVGGGAFGDDGGVDGGSRSAATPSGNSSSPSPTPISVSAFGDGGIDVGTGEGLSMAKVFLYQYHYKYSGLWCRLLHLVLIY